MTEKNLIDDSFYLEQSRWKTWSSYDKEGKKLVTSLSEETCIAATRFYLKNDQENENIRTYEGVVGGKL